MQKISVAYFTKHTTAGPSSRYRSYAYHSYLTQNGFAVSVYPLFPSYYLPHFYATGRKPKLTVVFAYLRRFLQFLFLKKYDLIYIEYELFPYLPFQLERWLLRNQNHIIIDYDDAIFHNYDNSKNEMIQNLCGGKIFKLVALADVVITGSPYLTSVLSRYAKKVVEIPTSISIENYLSTPAAPLSEGEEKAFRIGWIGSATTSSFVLTLKECLLQLQELYNMQLVLIGFDKKLEPRLQGLHYTIHDWKAETEIALLKTCDVGIMPLTNVPFNHGKCGFKLIQYMACGLPTIATPMEANIKINRGNANLFATTKFEWYSCFTVIIQNKELYKETGEKNIEIAEEYYSVKNNCKEYLSLFQSIAKKEV